MGKLDNLRKLEEFKKSIVVPNWYMGLSDYQERTVYGLANDLRDDYEQGTSFRVEKCLMRLGLNPLISKKKIRTMVQLSRGNDLAFIFFILEGYYISARKNGVYTSNEKLLMIAMAKIDLMPTLRELDRILPPPQLSKLEMKNQSRGIKSQRTSRIQPVIRPSRKIKSGKLPYFQRQTRPKEIPVKYISKPPNLIAAFPFWPLEQPPNYGTPTEAPWFAEYKLNPVGRLVKSIVGEAVDKYFDHLNKITQLERRARFSRRAATALEELMNTTADAPQLCFYHKFIGGEEQLIKDRLKVLARDRCIELMDVTMPYRKQREKRILAQLDRDIDDCVKRYSMKIESTTVHTIAKSDCVICREQRVDLPAAKPQEKEGRALIGDSLHLAHTQATEKLLGARLRGGGGCGGAGGDGMIREPVDFHAEVGPCNAQNMGIMVPEPEYDPQSCLAPKGKSQHRISFIVDDMKLRKLRKNRKAPRVDVHYEGKVTKKTFFTAPTDHTPYQFKYKRIFNSGQEKPLNLRRLIAKSFVRALDAGDEMPMPNSENLSGNQLEEEKEKDAEEVSCHLTDSNHSMDDTSNHSLRSHEDFKADIVNAVVRCAKDVWTKGVAVKRIEMDIIENLQKKDPNESSVLTYDIDIFDPDDSELMNRLLLDGMAELRKNQRFVLASLPDAHKLPVFQEWIRRRYGKEYTEEEIQENLQKSIKVFELIASLQDRPPQADLMGMDHLPPEKETFAHCKEANALAKKVRIAYYKKLNDLLLEHTFACWYAMGNYQNRSGPPKKTFYAYMSANSRDIMRNKVWNGEFRNVRRFRDAYKESHK